jgi:hypothetical protein
MYFESRAMEVCAGSRPARNSSDLDRACGQGSQSSSTRMTRAVVLVWQSVSAAVTSHANRRSGSLKVAGVSVFSLERLEPSTSVIVRPVASRA